MILYLFLDQEILPFFLHFFYNINQKLLLDGPTHMIIVFHIYFSAKLWTSPEILRNEQTYFGGTQKVETLELKN